MKKIFVFIIALAISLSVNAQSYQKLWNEYNEAIENFLPETAETVLDKIEKQALKDKNDVQLLKTVIKRCDIIAMTAENPQDTIPGLCKSYLTKLSKASQVIINVEIAKYCYKFDDILAYQDDDFIKTVSMENYAVLFENKNEKTSFDIELEPTLYDYVMHCIINNYGIYQTKDYYEKLLAFDIENNYIKAYYNNRINQLGQITEKNYDNFSQLATECPDNEFIAKTKIKQIEYLSYVNEFVKAKNLCDEVMAMLDKNNPLYLQCVEYNNSLTKKSINIQMNKVHVPNKPIPVGLTYRNTSNPSYKIIKVTADEFRRFSQLNNEELCKALSAKKPVVKNTVKATVETDYDEHSTLIALPAMQRGQYYLVFSNNIGFNNYEDLIITPFQVSELSYFSLDTDDYENIYIVNRETSEPMSDVKAYFWKMDYSYKTRDYKYTSLGNAINDKNGFLVAPSECSGSNFIIDLYYQNDTLLASTNEYFSKNTTKNRVTFETEIYTDRSIYRPGQTVQFKGITLRKNGSYYSIDANCEVVVEFSDPNLQLIDTLRLTSDEFGGFSGNFAIPTDRIRGTYHIDLVHGGGTTIKVEDYKRPTFEVTFESPEKEYKIGDSVTVSGKVAALSGFGLDNVNFRYEVTRITTFPFRCWNWVPYYVNDETISAGEGVTATDGSFNIDFELKPSIDVPVSHIPQFTYEVLVFATNKQGESQQGSFRIVATYNKYNISLSNNGETIDVSDLSNLMVNVTNVSGKSASTMVEYKIFKINDLDLYSKDLGNFDRKILSDALLKAYFPNFDYYSKENSDKEIVYQGVIDIDGNAKLLQNKKLTPAKYIVELRSVDDTLSAFSKKYVVCNVKSKKMPHKSMLWTNINKTTAQPGETINYYVGSSEKNVSALVIIKKGETILKSERITLNNNVIRIQHKVREEDRGRLKFTVALAKYNTYMIDQSHVNVPYNNMDLEITLNTERNKVLPGSEETWSVTVKDYKGNPVESSLMSVMYDASLDKFAKHNWELRTKPYIDSGHGILSDGSFYTWTKYQFHSISHFFIEENLMLSAMNLLPSQYNFGIKSGSMNRNLFYCMDDAVAEEGALVIDHKYDASGNTVFDETPETKPAKIRKDFNETAFFYPDLKTDENGDCTFTFTMPDALTRWNLMLLAYSKTLSAGKLEKTIVTQQPLMILADMPRFVYDEDTLWIAANVINLSEETLSPTAKLEIFDENNNPIELILSDNNINMKSIPVGGSQSVRWKVAMRKDVNPLIFRFSVITDGFSDAEQHLLPVLTTDVFLTQTYSLTVDANTLKEYEFNISKEDERNHDVKLEFKANPVFYVIQALPYIAEGNEKYATTAFNRYFVNMMAKQIVESNPNIEEMLAEHEADTLSELQKNEEVKAILLKETPWVLDAKNEAQQRANVSKLFDTEAIDQNMASAYDILAKKQTVNGGWSWIDGMPESEFITQYILCGLARLGINNTMTEKAFHFIENKVVTRYNKLDNQKKKDNAVCDFMTMKDLFAMSYFTYDISEDFSKAKTFYIKKLHNDWKRYSQEEQAYIALILNRNGYNDKALLIIKSLRERALKNELGMYWRNLNVESQARILEAFNEIEPITEEIDAMRLWILSQKRTNMWENERASVEAIFAIMNRGNDWTSEDAKASMIIGDDSVKVFLDNQSNHVVWGGLYRQYFVLVDKVQKHNDAMKIKREIIMPENVKVGDKVTVKITFENSQDMEFVYLKDLRGACFEPTEQLSRYHWGNGLWYYQSTTDVSMEYFFEYLPKGKHTVSYELYVTKDGSFSAGYSHIQCQYAPEFGAYSNGARISVNP